MSFFQNLFLLFHHGHYHLKILYLVNLFCAMSYHSLLEVFFAEVFVRTRMFVHVHLLIFIQLRIRIVVDLTVIFTIVELIEII